MHISYLQIKNVKNSNIRQRKTASGDYFYILFATRFLKINILQYISCGHVEREKD